MTIYYSLPFMLLAAEMVTFCVFVAPLPYVVKKRFFRFLSESRIIAKVTYVLKRSFVILFVDAVLQDVRTETNIAAHKFYAQRNTYLTGLCLFISLILTHVFHVILDLIRTQEEYAMLKKESNGGFTSGDQAGEIAELKNEITELKKNLAASEAKNRDFETLLKQSLQQAAEYDRLATNYNQKTGVSSNKKSD
ncbi:B-cell receptor-associated protein 31-like-domain-containing protein [Hygrophoropsis aurantiaca]|uniref:B-cell receptor-associated protein 31-like-domain-containing protein n=1 Tax=Hygrophoropsis aurantiaca TaxID=72124 RepID=A0ACB8AL52_9AGAM|nr:B-cell receptor-associated protein 31-like-domain-containing protein [Hygrophoropsis aurantiaca]